MTPPRFNLIDNPWITVRDISGDAEIVSIREAFSRANVIRRISGELPSQDFALLRILLAVLYRALEETAKDDPVSHWAQLWKAPELPLDRIDQYLDRWGHRFNLFDEAAPWFQVADLASTSGETKPVDLLIPDCPINGGLFTMRHGYSSITAAEAARWLVHCQAYDISGIKSGAVGDPRVKGGKGYPIGQGWCGWMGGITVVGDSLKETLLLNYVPTHQSEDDRPIWELSPLTAAPRVNAEATGQVALFTWPQRRIRLFPDTKGNVVSVLITNGDPVDYPFQRNNETMTGWRYSEPQSKKFKADIYMPRGFNPTESIWRGLPALLANDVEDERFKSASVLKWSADLAGNEVLPESQLIKVETVGVSYGPQSASWNEIFTDELAFNIRLAAAHGFPAKEIVFAAVARAVAGVRAVSSLAGNLQVAAGGDPGPASDRATALALSALDNGFRNWLRGFNPDGGLEHQLQEFTDSARALLLELEADLVSATGTAAWVGRKVTRNNQEHVISTGQADAWFRRALIKALPYAISSEGVNA